MLSMVFAGGLTAASPPLALPPAWQHWRDARPIEADLKAPGLVRFAIASDVYGKSNADLSDVRVIDDAGGEVPYAVDQRSSAQTVDWIAVPLSEQGFVRSQYTQAVADVGNAGDLHNELTVDTSADEFSTWVEVAASPDERTWRVVRTKAPIYRFSSDGLQGNLVVSFSPTRDRWLRIRVLRGTDQFPISGCLVANAVSVTPELATVMSALKVDASAPAHQTRLTADFGAPNIPVSAIGLQTSTAEFYRTVEVSTSDDGVTWNDAGQGDVYRDPRAGTSLQIHFPEARGRYWRVVVYNRNDLPLTRLQATLLATPRYVSFRAEPGKRYRLIYANAAADAPQYDFSRLTTADDRLSAPVVALGVEAAVPVVPPTLPWTEAHPVVLWLALLLAVGVLAWLAINAMRSKT